MSNEREVGDYVDLTHLNGKGVAPAVRKSDQEEARPGFDPGTHFTFRQEGGIIKSFRQIPVAFA